MNDFSFVVVVILFGVFIGVAIALPFVPEKVNKQYEGCEYVSYVPKSEGSLGYYDCNGNIEIKRR